MSDDGGALWFTEAAVDRNEGAWHPGFGFIGHRRGGHAKILKNWALRRRDFPDRVRFGHGQRWKTTDAWVPPVSKTRPQGLDVRQREGEESCRAGGC